MSRIRGEAEVESRILGQITGTIVPSAGRTVSFAGDLDDVGVASGWRAEDDPESESAAGSEGDSEEFPEPSQRVLRIDFDATQFQKVPAAGENELLLRLDARKFRYLEVGVELEIAGQVEAPKEVNDTLDVLVTPTNPPRVPGPVTILLTDEQKEPVGGASFRIASGGQLKDGGDQGTADGSGKVHVRPRAHAESCQITWSTTAGEHARHFFVELGGGNQALERRLHNLGYLTGPTGEDNVRTFQCDFRLEETGKIEDIAEALVAWHDRGVLPEQGPEPELDNDPFVVEGPQDAEDLSDPSDETEPG